MNRFAPIFSEITDSSIWEEPYHIRIVWMTMLAKKGPDHIVYCDAWKLHKWANVTVKEAEEALRVLSNPDRRKPGQEHGGRRIEAVEDGWVVLNGQKYEELMRKIAERVRKAKWARENRRKLKGGAMEKAESSRLNGEMGMKDLEDNVDKGTIVNWGKMG